ncbi:MAG: type II toxin-antitoxin system RelE/ParE family toxin, partial [Propionibacteriaceae bacterium]|nr:type II toxin-antitoxin system RelE/ParE family toxin [Propionibacteriaceae bacterium]
MGNGPQLCLHAPGPPYSVQLTLEATDDLEAALAVQRSQGAEALARFTADLLRAVERIAVLPELSRLHHGALRVTVLAGCPYRLWYYVDDAARAAILVGIVAVAHARPAPYEPGPRVIRSRQPYLAPTLPDPYPTAGWASDAWVEEDDQWWVSRMPGHAR